MSMSVHYCNPKLTNRTMNTPTPITDEATLLVTDIEQGGIFNAVHVQVAQRLETENLIRERDEAIAGRQAYKLLAVKHAQERDEAREELETERIRLAACGVVAMADTKKTRTKAREMLPEYRSASLSDVERRVDECIKLREQRDEFHVKIEELANDLEFRRQLYVLESQRCDRRTVQLAEARVQRNRLAEALKKAAPIVTRYPSGWDFSNDELDEADDKINRALQSLNQPTEP